MEPSKIDRIYSEINTEDDHTDHTTKRRISSILKVPRTPLSDLGSGNELIQGFNTEKRQKNFRRVSFADKIRVFPTDLQTNVESNHAEETADTRHEEPLNQNETTEIVQCEITGMNTLLHAPIQTSLQQMEHHDKNSGQEWNKMNRTLLFSEENEMDMTSGHTVMITHDIGIYEVTEKPRKIDFKSFSAELKMNKENSEMNEFRGPTQINEAALFQQKTNIGGTHKIKCDDFFKSLKSSKPFLTPAAEELPLPSPSKVPGRKKCPSELNTSFHLQRKSNITTVFGELNNKTAVTQCCLPNEDALASCHVPKQTGCGAVTLHCGDENMGMTIASTGVLPTGSSSLSLAKQQQNLERDPSVYYDSCTLKPSGCSPVISRDALLPSNQRISVTQRLFGSMPVLDSCKNPVSSSECADTEITSNCTGFIFEGNSKEISTFAHRTSEKQSKSVSKLMTRTVLGDDNMDITENQASTNSNVTGMSHSISYSERVASKQEAIYGNMELQNFSVKPGLWTTSHLDRKENTNGKSDCSNNRVLPVSADKTVMFTIGKDMELTKPIAYLTDRSLQAAGFHLKPQEEIESSKHNVIGPANDKMVAFSFEDNEMEFTKSYTVAVNHNFMQHCERDLQALPLQLADKTVYVPRNDMDMTTSNACVINQSLEYAGAQAVLKLNNEAGGRTPFGSTKGKIAVFSLSDENEMEITRSHTVALNYDGDPQGSNVPTATSVPSDKTARFTFSEDMEITRPIAYAVDKSLKSVTDSVPVSQQGTGTGKKRITRTAGDKTIVFSFGEDNEMEITKSCTVAVNHNFMQHCERDLQALPLQLADKTVVYASDNDMDMTKLNTCIISQSLKHAGAQAMHKLDNETDGKALIGSTKDKTVVFSLNEDNEMEITRSHTVAVNHDTLCQVVGPSPFPAERNYLLVNKNNTAVNKSTCSIPADKTMMLIHNNNTEITKPVQHVMESSQKSKEEEIDKVILAGLVEEELVTCEDNEMEITKSHTVAVNHDVQQMEGAPQELSLLPAKKTKVSGHNGNMATVCFPAETSMWMHSNDMEITKPLTDMLLKNSSSKALPQKGKEANKAVVSGPVEGKAIKLHDNEMEITKCHTAEVKHDIFSHCERRAPMQFYQEGMDITGSHSGMKSTHTNSGKLEKESKWEASSNQMLALATVDNIERAERHTIPMNNRSDQHLQSASKAALLIPLNQSSVFTCYQDGNEIIELLPNTSDGLNLEEKQVPNKNTEQQLGNMTTLTSHGLTQNIDITRDHMVSIYSPNYNRRNPEKKIVNSLTKSREKTVAFSDGETMEVTRNHTIRIEFMNTSNSNEQNSCPQAKSGSEIPRSVFPHEKELGITKTDKHIPDKSFPSFNVKLPIPVDNVVKQDFLKIQENQLESHTSGINHTEIATESLPVDDTAIKIDKAVVCEPGHVTKDWQTTFGSPFNNSCSEVDPVLLPKHPGIVNDCSYLASMRMKPEVGLMSQNARPNLAEELIVKPKDPLMLRDDILIESRNSVDSSELKNKTYTEDDPFSVPMQKNNCQIKKFPAKLPNKRKPTISSVEDTGERTKPRDSENSLLIKKPSEKCMQHLSPSHYISEELLPPYVEEMDSSDQSCEVLEKVCDVMDKKQITNNKGCLKETNRQKRVWNTEGEELQKEKKLKVDQGWRDTTELKQPFSRSLVANEETLEDKNSQDTVASSIERTHSSNSSSLDSMKADSDLSIQQNTKIENELLMDTICEQNLQEKLQEGVITVGEFFTLLQVHVLIQKPRQSLLPPKYTVNESPIPEDLILSQYVYHPKLQIYNEDCQALSEIIEELKLCADNKDKLLVNVHKSLWEVMRTCSDEELKDFGAELNKMKSCFAKKSKVLAHRGKAKLYTKLVQNTQLQWGKLQSRLNKLDELCKEMDNCRIALEAETAKLEEFELEVSDSVAEYESKLRQTEQELENYKAQEEALQRQKSNVKEEQQKRISEISCLQEDAKSCQESMKKCNFSEWVMKEWNDQQAVFTFLYESIELTVALGCPVDETAFTAQNLYRKIVDVKFESLLDEAKAPDSSKLVQRLIFQFIHGHSSWQEKYSTVYHLHQLLHDVSLVVSRCQLLGEEIEFLNRWGGKFNLLKTAVNDTKVKLLFSSSLASAKFEVELSLSANYPISPAAFTVQKCTGNLGQEEISEVLSRVPVGVNYLKRMVHQIHHSLLQNPSNICK